MGEAVSAGEVRRCNQCWREKPWPSAFAGKRGRPAVKNCAECRAKYGRWAGMSPEQRVRAIPERRDPPPRGKVLWVASSKNKKTGPMPVSVSERGTCPPSCAFFRAGCYANYGHLGAHWRALPGTLTASRWLPWAEFLRKVRGLPQGTVWRHNEAGDLQGRGQELDAERLGELVEANRGRAGFTYTHKTSPENFDLFRWANLEGFAVNLSADSLEEADRLAEHGSENAHLPLTAVVPPDYPARGQTPGGLPVVVCPAQTTPGQTCSSCRLCSKPFRKSVVGFRAHGQSANLLAAVLSGRRHLRVVGPAQERPGLDDEVAGLRSPASGSPGGERPGAAVGASPGERAATARRLGMSAKMRLVVHVSWEEFSRLTAGVKGTHAALWAESPQIAAILTPKDLAEVRRYAAERCYPELLPSTRGLPAKRLEWLPVMPEEHGGGSDRGERD